MEMSVTMLTTPPTTTSSNINAINTNTTESPQHHPSELCLSLLLCDASFPGGSLANSNGLESAILNNLVIKNDLNSFLMFLDMSIEQIINQSLPFVRTSYYNVKIANNTGSHTASAADNDIHHKLPCLVYKSIYDLDEYYHAFLSNGVSRRTSINQGKCFIRVIKECFPSIEQYFQPLLNPCYNNSNDNRASICNTINTSNNYLIHGHYSIYFGMVCALLHISLELCEKMFLKIFIRDLLSAAIRLNQIGPIESMKIQVSAFIKIEKILNDLNIYSDMKWNDYYQSYCKDNCSEATANEDLQFYLHITPTQTAPIIDLLQSKHDQLYSRLFSS